MEYTVEKFHFENLKAALEYLAENGDLQPEVTFVKDGEPYVLANPELNDDGVNPGVVALAVLEQTNAELVNFICLGLPGAEEGIDASRTDTQRGQNLVLIAVTFDRSGPQLGTAYEIVDMKPGEVQFRDAQQGKPTFGLRLKARKRD